MAEANDVRMEVTFRGRVQGVWFRATTQSVAGRFAVTGTVRNQPDGSVFLRAEGARAELERFLAGIEEEKRGHIDSREVSWSDSTGEFGDFRIVY